MERSVDNVDFGVLGLVAEDGALAIGLVGHLPAILAFAGTDSRKRTQNGVQIAMVAGERYHLYRTHVAWP